jgi:hypothetical protein
VGLPPRSRHRRWKRRRIGSVRLLGALPFHSVGMVNTEVVMRYMNEWEIEEAVDRFAGQPILGPATVTLQNLQRWTNSHSDGWAYWPKPCRAAAKLQELIEEAHPFRGAKQPTEAEYKAALRPIKAFRTRQGAEFEIVDL